MTNGIAQASTAMHQAQLQQQVGMHAMRMGLETSEQQAEGIQRLMGDAAQLQQQAVHDPAVGQQVNITV